MTAKDHLHIEAIKFRDGRVVVIEYVFIDLPVRFEKRGQRFQPAWTVK